MKSWDWSKVKKFFLSDWQIKLASLVIATLLYYYVNSISYEEQTYTLPIKFQNMPTNLRIINLYDTAVTFTVKGKGDKLRSYDFMKTVTPVVNLEKAEVGFSNYQIELNISSPPPDMTINLAKEKVALKIDKLIQKLVQIKPVTRGSLKEGYFLENMTLNKDFILIAGPEEFIKDTNYVETAPIDISDETNDITQPVIVKLPKMTEVLDTNDTTISIHIVKISPNMVIVTNTLTNDLSNVVIIVTNTNFITNEEVTNNKITNSIGADNP